MTSWIVRRTWLTIFKKRSERFVRRSQENADREVAKVVGSNLSIYFAVISNSYAYSELYV
jgi:hypothetical protein